MQTITTWRIPNIRRDIGRWTPGPWDDEPDKVQWPDEATGLPCLVVRGPVGCWCGYVGVPRSHPAYGVNYMELNLDAHGGLTFSDRCMENGPVCHVVEPGEDDDVWWLGFDCGHAFDVVPSMVALLDEVRERDPKMRELDAMTPNWMRDTYRDLGYVRAEVQRLAAQLAGYP